MEDNAFYETKRITIIRLEILNKFALKWFLNHQNPMHIDHFCLILQNKIVGLRNSDFRIRECNEDREIVCCI